jgi:hypothetical protein
MHGEKGATAVAHHEMYVRAVMADRMREAAAARRARGEAHDSRRTNLLTHPIVALIARMVLR